MADLAAEAEAAGWDGVFYYDAIAIGHMEVYDPWVVLAAMAIRTQRVRLGLIVAAPARRRPWKLAREAMSVDRLSGGRLVLPVGLGTTDDLGFGNVGEPTDAKTRAELGFVATPFEDGARLTLEWYRSLGLIRRQVRAPASPQPIMVSGKDA